jgi:hypothetical protein
VYQLANAQAPVVSCAAPYVRPVEQAEPGFRNKGLKQFGLKVCEKISSRGRTTYNEVNELGCRRRKACKGSEEWVS